MSKSDNTQGNPYHDEEGKFTNKNNVGSGGENDEKSENQNATQVESKPFSKFKIKSNVNSQLAMDKLREMLQVSSIPFLTSANDIINYIDRYFGKTMARELVDMYGKQEPSRPYLVFNEIADPSHRAGQNIFISLIGKRRYPENFIKKIDASTYNIMRSNYAKYDTIWRGISAPNNQMGIVLMDSYSDPNNIMMYGGGMYGTNGYTAHEKSYADFYNSNGLMTMVLDKENAKTLSIYALESIQSNLISRKETIRQKVKERLQTLGVDEAKSTAMSTSFCDYTLYDIGLVAVLCGIDYFSGDNYGRESNGNQRNILNWGKVYRLV